MKGIEFAEKVRMKITDRAYLRIPIEVRERYLTPKVDRCSVQCVGHSIQVTIRSDRYDVLLMVPSDTWITTNARVRTVDRNGAYIGEAALHVIESTGSLDVEVYTI